MYRLYYSPGACSMAVHIILKELAVPHELELVSVEARATSSPAYLAVNPKGRVPALQIGSEILTEAGAILTFLAHRHHESSLLPSDPLLFGRCLEWQSWLSSEVHPAFALIWRPERFTTQAASEPDVMAKGREAVRARCGEIEERLSSIGSYAVGDSFTIVDPYLFVFFGWARHVGLNPGDYPAWSRHAALLSSRASVRSALSQEGLLKAA